MLPETEQENYIFLQITIPLLFLLKPPYALQNVPDPRGREDRRKPEKAYLHESECSFLSMPPGFFPHAPLKLKFPPQTPG